MILITKSASAEFCYYFYDINRLLLDTVLVCIAFYIIEGSDLSAIVFRLVLIDKLKICNLFVFVFFFFAQLCKMQFQCIFYKPTHMLVSSKQKH